MSSRSAPDAQDSMQRAYTQHLRIGKCWPQRVYVRKRGALYISTQTQQWMTIHPAPALQPPCPAPHILAAECQLHAIPQSQISTCNYLLRCKNSFKRCTSRASTIRRYCFIGRPSRKGLMQEISLSISSLLCMPTRQCMYCH